MCKVHIATGLSSLLGPLNRQRKNTHTHTHTHTLHPVENHEFILIAPISIQHHRLLSVFLFFMVTTLL